MSASRQWVVVGAVTLVLLVLVMVGMRVANPASRPVGVGAKAPPWAARTITTPHQVKTGADYEGQVVLLNFWATWCGPCKVEMPSMEALHRDFHDKGLRIVAVSQDDDASDEQLRDFAKSLGVTFEVLYDSTHAMERTWQVTGYPASFVIDKDGEIRRKWLGADDWNSPENRALIAQLLGVKDGRTASR
ncbi:MAG TPA: TlpA disulfide reductase family protein [Gemmatimonadaceae bacterium]